MQLVKTANRDSHDSPPSSAEDGWWSRERALVLVLAAGTVISLYLCYRLAYPSLPAVAWALALAVVAHPLHARITARCPRADLAAAISLTLIVIIVVGPALCVAEQLVAEAGEGMARLQTGAESGRWRETADRYPQFAAAFRWVEEHFDVRAEAQRFLTAFVGDAKSLVTGSVWAVLQLLIVLLTLYYFLRDQPKALQALRSLAPLSDAETDDVLKRVADTIHATVYGTLLVALVQGALGGLMFWWLGLPAPVLWGVVMGLLAVVPWLGAFVVWAPAAAVLALEGEGGKALILVAWGTVVVGLIDNLLYPILVGDRLRLHTLPVFFAILGGLTVFGAAGIVLGPVVLAVTVALLNVWRRRTAGGRTAEEGVHGLAAR